MRGFEVDSQCRPRPGVVILEATVGRLKARGATITMELVRILVGSLAFVQDPNGARIALVEHRREIARPSA